MNFLIIHQNFPGQFRHVALAGMKRPNVRVLAVGRDTAPGLAGVKIFRYRPVREASTNTHPYLYSYEKAVLHGQQVFRLLMSLKRKGYFPDVILAHPGWGETLFVKDVYPVTPLIHFCEYYYQSTGADLGFDPEFQNKLDAFPGIRTLNSMHLLNLEQCDVGITPTHWQHSLHPEVYRPKIRVIHEGISVQGPEQKKASSVRLPSGYLINAGQPIVTYVARNLEPYRGFHTFMRSIPIIQRQCPDAQIVIVGGNGVSYGKAPTEYSDWRSKYVAELDVNLSKVHFTGKLPYETYIAILQLSSVHVYLTYPFVLSWSLLEAMAAGCVVVGSDTAPVREVIVDGMNGFLVDFFDSEAIAKRVCEILKCRSDFNSIRESARATATGFDARKGVDGYFEVLDGVRRFKE